MGVDVLNPIQPECMDIYKLKDTFGHKMSFWGGISTQKTLPYGKRMTVKKKGRSFQTASCFFGGIFWIQPMICPERMTVSRE